MKNNKMLTVMLIILVSITLIGVVFFVMFTQLKESKTLEPTIDEILEASVDVPEITTNLADKRFVKMQLKIQTNGKKSAEELAKRDFQVNNLIIQELSEMTQEDLKGKEGKVLFEKTLKVHINDLMQVGEVKQVYITSYIIQ
ncbi:flagellar basal body-associated protein FliL [Solibacillus sp. CAU 1738]|uniref:flagellar basal body-associated protein FliL n=1 Tax=Solibacillus sp. CAU 1738 TaxID=3140363 RepID=UPI00326156ED